MLINKQKVRELRNERGWTQSHLAELCDVSLRTIQRIESNGNSSSESLMAISAIFEIDKTLLIDSAQLNHDQPSSVANKFKLLPILAAIGVGIALGATSTYVLFVA